MSITTKSDQRHAIIRQKIVTSYEKINGLSCPWSPKHAGILANFLKSCGWSAEAICSAVDNRFQSEEINECADPAQWIFKLVNYARGPLDKYQRPIYQPKADPLKEWGKRVDREAAVALGRVVN